MASSFDLEIQNSQIEHRIIAALERIAEVFRVLLWEQSKKFGLSPIQIQILIFLHTHSREKCKVSYLAQEFHLTKPTVSDAIQSLIRKELITKERNPSDSRSFELILTHTGRILYQEISLYTNKLLEPIQNLSPSAKENLLQNFLDIIHQLYESGIISLQRMCYSCKYYKREKNMHYCMLLEKSLYKSELRLDCPDYIAK